MIPVDLAARLRLLTEASFFQTDQPVHELNRVRAVQADPPEYTPGQRLTATIERPLPDGLFRALVAGKAITLAIQTGENEAPVVPGRTLALEVTRSTPQAVHAQIVPTSQKAEMPAALSQTGRLISILLTGQPPQAPTALAGGKPLLSTPPSSGPPLVPLLKDALTQSGLFYEAHQAQWLAGKVELSTLRQEPQGQLPPPAPPGEAPETVRPEVATIRGNPAAVPGAPLPLPGEQPAGLVDLARELLGLETKAPATAEPGPRPAAQPGTPIPDRILPLVGQQLDALATQQFVWQGQVWPGQTMEWEIEDPTGGGQEGEREGQDWNTTLRLTLPQLGLVEARLQLGASGVKIRLLAAEPESRTLLAAEKEILARSLDNAHVPLLGMTVERPDGEP